MTIYRLLIVSRLSSREWESFDLSGHTKECNSCRQETHLNKKNAHLSTNLHMMIANVMKPKYWNKDQWEVWLRCLVTFLFHQLMCLHLQTWNNTNLFCQLLTQHSQTKPSLPLSLLKLYLSKPLGNGRCSDHWNVFRIQTKDDRLCSKTCFKAHLWIKGFLHWSSFRS